MLLDHIVTPKYHYHINQISLFHFLTRPNDKAFGLALQDWGISPPILALALSNYAEEEEGYKEIAYYCIKIKILANLIKVLHHSYKTMIIFEEY